MSIGVPSQPESGAGQQPANPESTDLNEVLIALREAVYNSLTAVLRVLWRVPDDILRDPSFAIATGYIQNHFPKFNLLTPEGLELTLTLAAREGFDWEQQLQAAETSISRVNAANADLNLQTEYSLPNLINALAAQNNPDQLMANLKLMQKPTLVIAPAGLALKHLAKPLTHNNISPYINYNYPCEPRSKTAAYIIDAGDLGKIDTQPEVIQTAAQDKNDRLTLELTKNTMDELGMRLDAIGWAMLAEIMNNQNPVVALDSATISVLNSQELIPSKLTRIASASFFSDQFYFYAYHFSDANWVLRARASVMAMSFGRFIPSP